MTAALERWKASVENSLAGADYVGRPEEFVPQKKRNKR